MRDERLEPTLYAGRDDAPRPCGIMAPFWRLAHATSNTDSSAPACIFLSSAFSMPSSSSSAFVDDEFGSTLSLHKLRRQRACAHLGRLVADEAGQLRDYAAFAQRGAELRALLAVVATDSAKALICRAASCAASASVEKRRCLEERKRRHFVVDFVNFVLHDGSEDLFGLGRTARAEPSRRGGDGRARRDGSADAGEVWAVLRRRAARSQ